MSREKLLYFQQFYNFEILQAFYEERIRSGIFVVDASLLILILSRTNRIDNYGGLACMNGPRKHGVRVMYSLSVVMSTFP